MPSTSENVEILARLIIPGSSNSLLDRWITVARALHDQTALESPGVSYTFAEADALSDLIAAKLTRELPDDDAPVGAFLGHTAPALLGFLGIMKAGRIVVALDSHLPNERLRDISTLAGVTTYLVDEANEVAAAELGVNLTNFIRLDEIIAQHGLPGAVESDGPPPAAGLDRRGRDAVSIVFTSGSTGRPKGVLQTHDQLLNDVYAHGQRFRIGPKDRVALVLPYGFAAGLSLLFGALLNGASVWSFDPRDGGVRGLVSWIDEQRLSTLHCTPHLLRSLVSVLGPGKVMASLRLVATVGEAVHGRDVEAIRPHLPSSASFFNWSGSSEVGILALHEIPGDARVPEGIIPAGRPVANRDVPILREDGSPAPQGEAGEIVTISDYLSGGYWRDEAANEARFSVDTDGRRVCRQGDQGRFDEHGDLVLLGRVDAAVKVRGYLVEPAEIEAAFLATNGIAEVVVLPVVNPPAPTRLIAYVVSQPGLRPQSPAALRRSLRARLPEYMVPADIIQLSALPRNERGKIDRAQLPDVPAPSLLPSSEPMSQWELVIADIWSDVLGLEVIGLDHDFMSLGGDSLSAEELFTIVEERFSVSMVSSDLIASPTLREFTRRVKLGSAALPSHPDVVTLQSGGIRTPLFCFAGSGALALTFLPLSRHFPDRDIYAFQAHGLEKRAVPDRTVEGAARRFLEIIRVVQPRGPYLLLGHSFGGLVALEIARLLSEAGQTVELVGLLDTHLPRTATAQAQFTFEPMIERPSGSAVIRRAREALQEQGRRILPRGLPAVRVWSRQARAHLAGVIPHVGQRQFDAFFDHGQITSRRYRVKPYGGRVLLVLADENPDGPQGWHGLLTGSHEFFEIPSEHSSLLREPHATALAAIVQTELDRVSQ
jgi:acyl-coenzyme A synthetase/AMP-(fatty) acid ligase/thioesterase domain-containing protein/acyl carrier protein